MRNVQQTLKALSHSLIVVIANWISTMYSRECEVDNHEVTTVKNKTVVEDNKKTLAFSGSSKNDWR